MSASRCTRRRPTSLREKLLYDMRRVFKDREAMHTATIVDELKELEDSPWKSRRLTAWGMADMLSEFSEYPNGRRIRSCRVTINGKQKARLPRSSSRTSGGATSRTPTKREVISHLVI